MIERALPRPRSDEEVLTDRIVTRIHEHARATGDTSMIQVEQALYLDGEEFPDATDVERIARLTGERCPELRVTEAEIEAYQALCEDERRRF
jgi:hypothetical protein